MGIKIGYEAVRANARVLYHDASANCSASASKARSLEKAALPGVWRGEDADALAGALAEWSREAERLQQDLERLKAFRYMDDDFMNMADRAEENEKRMLAEKAQASSSGASVSGRTEPGMKLAAGILGGWKKK